MALLSAWDGVAKPVVGMLHLPPLPGSPRFAGNLAAIRERLAADLDALISGGIDGLMIENFGDAPFYPRRVPPITAAHMTALAAFVRSKSDLPLGINLLRNDGLTGLAIAHAVGAQFIRVNVFCGARVTDQGVLEGIACELVRERASLGAGDIRIFADVSVKHSSPLGLPRPLQEETADAVQRGGADAIVVSGAGTGLATDREDLRLAKKAAGGAPVFVGSGVSAGTIGELADLADGFIVGTSLKKGGQASAPVEPELVRAIMTALRG